MGYHSMHLTNAEIRDALRKEFSMEQINALILADIRPASTRRRGVVRKGNKIRVFAPGFVITLYERKSRPG